jgi:mercuric ion binding protein
VSKACLVLFLLVWSPIAGLAADQEVVTIEVAGLACPFCVYSLEKNLAKLDDIESVEVDLKTGTARIAFGEGGKVDLDVIRQAIVKAGFTPGAASTRLVQ